MIPIFEYLNDILQYKKCNLLNNVDNESTYLPFLVNRWLSFYSDQHCKIINGTVNRYWPILQNKQDHYRFLAAIIPNSSIKRINYIKKVKPEEKEKDFSEVVKLLACNLQISQREVNMYVEQTELDLEPYAKVLKKQ